ncbi:diguanylate cyclase domain-containing protein [Methyloversatilis sp.]|uniref:diguanylate cyclase domain-containing protein n=1 Tax=Methyloversatilis sp. TaxID=2569862 RepID=UPI0035B1B889
MNTETGGTARSHRLSHSIVWRTTLLILFFAGLVGALVAMASTVLVAREEMERLQQNLVELMGTVERTASIAAFARDEQLAAEVAQGLLRNGSVAKVVIREGGRELVAMGEQQEVVQGVPAIMTRALPSPFSAAETVGELEIWPARTRIEHDAGAYSRFIAIILGLQLIAVIAAVAWVVLNVITRPVKRLSDQLHQLEIGSAHQVDPPPGHGEDEIGRLADDINGLIARMDGMLAAERDLRAQREVSERKFRLIFESAETGIFTLDSAGLLQDWNPWLSRVLGLAAHEAGQSSGALRAHLGDHASRLDALMVRVLSDQRPAGTDFQIVSAHGNEIWLHLVLNPIAGNLMQGIANDVTEQKRAEACALAMAERDPLTGLLNRRGMEHRLGSAIGMLEGGGLALMLLDLDGFKQVNDTMGHDAGDRVLVEVARQLESVVRRTDLVARLGGDEFVIVLCALETPDTARFIAAKVVGALARPMDLGDGRTAQIGGSVGVAYTEDRSHTPDALMQRADDAMYEAKRAGKSQFRFAT